jgi:hypothetical protein
MASFVPWFPTDLAAPRRMSVAKRRAQFSILCASHRLRHLPPLLNRSSKLNPRHRGNFSARAAGNVAGAPGFAAIAAVSVKTRMLNKATRTHESNNRMATFPARRHQRMRPLRLAFRPHVVEHDVTGAMARQGPRQYARPRWNPVRTYSS